MPLILADRVFETTTSIGTGTISLGGAPIGFRTFVAGCGNGAVVPYVIDNGVDWECGVGTVTDGSPDTLSRDTILSSSNGGSAVNWGAGTKNVILSIPAARTASKTYVDEGFSVSGAINEAQGTNIASAATTNIASATGNYVTVTGTNTITALGTAQAGARRTVTFNGALTLTHNATSLILPTGANIQTAAGDTAVFISLGSGNWRCTSYQRANGQPLSTPFVGGGGCSLVQQSAQSIPNNAFTALTFGSGSENWDDNSYHDVTTNNSRITPGFIGRGQFVGQVTLSTTGAITKSLKLYKNGAPTTAEFRVASNADSGGHVLQVIHEDSFNATDYYELFVAHVTGASVNTVAAGTTFQFRRT